jgi:hypothetical protein
VFLHLAIHYLGAAGPVKSTAPASPVDNPAPASPVSGHGIDLLLGYAKWGSLAACAASALISGGVLAVGQLSNRPDHADKGKRALLWSLGGAAVVALAIPTLNTIFGAA